MTARPGGEPVLAGLAAGSGGNVECMAPSASTPSARHFSGAEGAVDSARQAVDAGADQAADSAREVRHSHTLRWATRAGLACYGVVHLLLAWLAVEIALGRTSREGDQSGAFGLLASQPGGRALLVLLVVGMAALTVWQLLLALVGHTDKDGARRVLERAASAARAVVYAFLGVSAARVAAGSGKSSAGEQSGTTAGVLGMSGGRFLVTLAGLLVIALGVGLCWYGLARRFQDNLQTERMSRAVRRLATVLGAAGYAAKGVAFGIAGVLLVVAAVRYDPQKARGLDAALREVAARPYGAVLLSLIALGLAAFGAFCFVQARYRKV
jgi:Domain of Unknown Function (DUF1206)